MPLVATISIVARDAQNGDLGVAVQSRMLAVGALVPWARAEIGALATQARANVRYGPDGLELMATGQPAPVVLQTLLGNDPDREVRQLALVDAEGRAAAFTGAECMPWSGHLSDANWAVAGNLLPGPAALAAMRDSFMESERELPERLVAALAAGDAAIGEQRGRRAAALLVVRPHGAFDGGSDRYVDLRVDAHPDPLTDLEHLLRLHRFYLTPSDPATLVPLDAELTRELQEILSARGYYAGPIDGRFEEITRGALEVYGSYENLDLRLTTLDRKLIDPQVIEYLRRGGLEGRKSQA